MNRSALAAGIRQLRRILAAQQPSEDSDEQLLHAFHSNRDDNAFAVLVRRHGPMVLRVCRHVLGHEQDAEDAFQATFLALARNTAAVRNQATLAGFLHGIAYRTALKARQTAIRRRKHESSLGALTQPRSPTDPADEISWREARALLDEEIARLSEDYRSVFVLCCLEDMSRAEAARRLGLKERTVSYRLTEARKRLARRLARRGVELTAVLAASTLATQAASALPAGLMVCTVKAALATAAGEQSASVVSASVAELVKGVAMATRMSRAEMTAVFVVAAGLLAGAGAWTYRTMMIPSPAESQAEAFEADPQPDQPHKAPWPQLNKTEGITVTGRVLDPDGKAKAGAKLLLLDKSDSTKQIGVAAADGRFIVAIPKAARDPYLIAQAEGTGIDFIHLAEANPEKAVELRLVKDNPIRGRVVNTEGKPIGGVRVAVKSLNVYANNSLDSFQRAWKKHFFISGMPDGVKGFRSEAGRWSATATAGVLLATMTDADGLFTLNTVGTERVALLRLSGAGIADNEVWVVNREGFDAKPYNEEFQNVPKRRIDYEFIRLRSKRLVLHGPNVSVLAEPEKRIRGVVTDADSGKGRPNAVVRLLVNMDAKGRYPIAVPIQTQTDAEGRYEIHGALKAKSYLIGIPSDPSTGYMACQIRADDTSGYEPLTAIIRVKKGVIVTGKIVERASGKPVPGFAKVGVLINNPFAKDYPGFNFGPSEFMEEKQETSADGTFRIVTIPGPVLLMGGPVEVAQSKKYQPPSPDPQYPQYFHKELKGSYHHLDSPDGQIVSFIHGNFCKVLEIKPGVAIVKQDIVLERRKPSIWDIFK